MFCSPALKRSTFCKLGGMCFKATFFRYVSVLAMYLKHTNPHHSDDTPRSHQGYKTNSSGPAVGLRDTTTKLTLASQGNKGGSHARCLLTLWRRQTLPEKGWKAPPHGVFSPFQGREGKTSLSVGTGNTCQRFLPSASSIKCVIEGLV